MTRKRRKAAVMRHEIALANEFATQHGDYRPALVMHEETGTIRKAHVNRESFILDRWMREGEPYFPPGACEVIKECQRLWHCLGSPKLVARYGEWMPPSTGDGLTQHEASAEIAHLLKDIPRAYRDVFENVVRHNEPAGVAGSRLATNPAGQIAAARHIVGLVACFIASRHGY